MSTSDIFLLSLPTPLGISNLGLSGFSGFFSLRCTQCFASLAKVVRNPRNTAFRHSKMLNGVDPPAKQLARGSAPLKVACASLKGTGRAFQISRQTVGWNCNQCDLAMPFEYWRWYKPMRKGIAPRLTARQLADAYGYFQKNGVTSRRATSSQRRIPRHFINDDRIDDG